MFERRYRQQPTSPGSIPQIVTEHWQGVYLLVFSFFVQTVGAILILLDLRNAK
jgi:hypothetical protein